MAEEGVGFAHFPHVPHVPDVEGVVVVDDADPSVLLVVADGHRVGVLSLLQVERVNKNVPGLRIRVRIQS